MSPCYSIAKWARTAAGVWGLKLHVFILGCGLISGICYASEGVYCVVAYRFKTVHKQCINTNVKHSATTGKILHS